MSTLKAKIPKHELWALAQLATPHRRIDRTSLKDWSHLAEGLVKARKNINRNINN